MTGFEAFEQYVLRAMDGHKIPGMSVAIAKDGEVMYAKGFGLRDRSAGLAVTPDTVFGIASVSKSFTALAIMQLVDAGKIAVDDSVTKHLPKFSLKGVDWLDEIKIFNLLSHTTGLPPLPGLGYAVRESMKDYPKWDDGAKQPDDSGKATPDLSTFDKYLKWLADEDIQMVGRPGEYFSYSNDCYCLLAAIIEHVTGTDYYDYMNEHVLGACGMTRSTLCLEELGEMDNVTRLYFNNIRRETKDVPRWQDCRVYDAGGGIRSTALDLVKYGQMYVAGGMASGRRIASEASVREMYRPVYKYGRNSCYAYGLQVLPNYSGVTLVEHGGALTGVSSHFGFVPEKGISVAVLTNVGGVPAADIWLCAVNTALGLPLRQKRSAEPRDYRTTIEHLDRFVGVYKSGEGALLKVFRADNDLWLEMSGERFPLWVSDDATLVADVHGQERVARFYSDEAGKVWAVFSGLRMMRKAE